MKRYYVYCDDHGKTGRYYDENEKNEASRSRRKHVINNPGCRAKVIEEYTYERYGKTFTGVRVAM